MKISLSWASMLLLSIALFSCGGGNSQKDDANAKTENTKNENTEKDTEVAFEERVSKTIINEKKMGNYMEALKKIKAAEGSFESLMNSRDPDLLKGKAEYDQMLKIVKEAGFQDLEEFVYTHFKVSFAYAMEEMKNADQLMGEGMKEGMKELEEALNNEDVPDEVKKQLKQTKEMLNDDANKTVNNVVNSFQEIGKNISEEEMKVVQKMRKDLEKLYNNMDLPNK